MNAPEAMLVLIFLRLILPFGILLAIGEGNRNRDHARPARR
jgi:hypothetical protein